ncbi:MAG TPA: trimeric intracellular cation channel family protein [Cyclobacteriaceae bacterium]|nr:trimeric intracellular cation channel family protein [Cyclobacteriaceae bacterium]
MSISTTSDMLDALSLTTVLDLMGTFAFAMSGIRLASGKNMDWFGAYIVGLVTAIGGGTTRDLLLDLTPFWMLTPLYVVTTGFALIIALVFKGRVLHWGNTLFLFDAIGLGLFTIVGISKSLDAGLPIWVCIMMGTITGVVGGVIRDVLINEVPLIFRKDIYALACVAGGIVYFICLQFPVSSNIAAVTAAVSVIVIRILAVRYHIHLPLFRLN